MNFQKKSNLAYEKLAKNKKKLPTQKAGRYKKHKGLENRIFEDIRRKLDLKKNDDLLDIGCGCGPLTDLVINYCQKKNIHITLCDIPPIINFLKKKYVNKKNISFISKEFQSAKILKNFKKILCYSVIQCVDKPNLFTKKIISLLSQDGKILIGDIPNINQKFRFLQSSFGKKYESMNNPKNKNDFKSFSEFKKETKQNTKINDDYIMNVLKYCRKKNKSSKIIKQKKILPFSFTREDILIEEF